MGIYSTMHQGDFLSIFYSGGSNPFILWETHVKDGLINRFLDPDLKTLVTDIRGLNVSTTYMTCPKGNKSLGIYLPFMVMIVKNLKKYFTFEVTIVDETSFKRRFRVANFQSCTTITPNCTAMPIGLADGWNQIQFNLSDFTHRAYNTHFKEVVRLRINANIRIKRIYFAARLVDDEDLPFEYKLLYPLNKAKKTTERKQEAIQEFDEKIQPQTSKELLEVVEKRSQSRTSSIKSAGKAGSAIEVARSSSGREKESGSAKELVKGGSNTKRGSGSAKDLVKGKEGSAKEVARSSSDLRRASGSAKELVKGSSNTKRGSVSAQDLGRGSGSRRGSSNAGIAMSSTVEKKPSSFDQDIPKKDSRTSQNSASSKGSRSSRGYIDGIPPPDGIPPATGADETVINENEARTSVLDDTPARDD